MANGNGKTGALNVLRLVRDHVPLRIGELVVEREKLLARLLEINEEVARLAAVLAVAGAPADAVPMQLSPGGCRIESRLATCLASCEELNPTCLLASGEELNQGK